MISGAEFAAQQVGYSRTLFLTGLLGDRLPPLPRQLHKLQCALEDCTTDLEQTCSTLREHPLILRNFLDVANMTEPDALKMPLDQLVLLLGKRRAWNIAVAAFILMQVDSEWATQAMRQVAILGHEQGNQALAMARLFEDEAPEQAYVCGFLSVIGLLPLVDTCLENEIPDWIGISAKAIQKQQELFGTDYVELGHWIRLLWHLPLQEETSVPAELLGVSSPTLESAKKAGNLLVMAREPVRAN